MGLKAQNKIHSGSVQESVTGQRRPPWLKVSFRTGDEFSEVNRLIKEHKLNTVCGSARCPNIGECWGHRTATFMILGDTCTRSCGFCAVNTGMPEGVDWAEPLRVADAVAKLGLKHVVITSVDRDELEDGGAKVWAATIRAVRKKSPECRIEVLIPDFRGVEGNVQIVLDAEPDILNHNLETVERLYRSVRPQANYRRSLEVLEYAKKMGFRTKSGIMVGIGETRDEVLALMGDLREVDCDILTIGQYLQPTRSHLPVHRYVTPEEFALYTSEGREMGFKHVESGPLVRSSYHAHEQVPEEEKT